MDRIILTLLLVVAVRTCSHESSPACGADDPAVVQFRELPEHRHAEIHRAWSAGQSTDLSDVAMVGFRPSDHRPKRILLAGCMDEFAYAVFHGPPDARIELMYPTKGQRKQIETVWRPPPALR